jgi:hypothetical protein
MPIDSNLEALLPPQFGEQLQATLVALTGALVLFVIAVAVAFVGWLIALGLSRAVGGLFVLLGLDAPVVRLQSRDRARATAVLPSRIAGYVTFWSLFLAACILALRVTGLDLVPSITERLQDVVPRILTSILVLIAGIPIAMAGARLLNSLFPASVSRSGRLRYQAFVSVLIGIVALLALEQLGLAAQFVVAVGVTAVGATGLALALAFGLGCRDLARDLIVEYLRASESDTGTDRP